jgi:chemotaxis protein MotB
MIDTDPLEEPAGVERRAPHWLTTWADMMSVLLTFFIVLQTFSTLSESKFQEAMSSIQRAFRIPIPILSPGDLAYDRLRTAEAIERELSDRELHGITVQDFGDRIVLTADSEMLFPLGKSDLSAAGQRIMDGVARALSKAPGTIRVEGHTCDLPVGSGSGFRDNWDLSSQRALSVLHELADRGVKPERMAATGYGEFRPIVPNDTPEHRQQNRRVEFVIEKAGRPADAFDEDS